MYILYYFAFYFRISSLILNRFYRPWLYSDFAYSKSSYGKDSANKIRILHNFGNKVI